MGGIILEWMQEVMNKLDHIVIVNNSMKEFLENRELCGKLEMLKQRCAGGRNIKRVTQIQILLHIGTTRRYQRFREFLDLEKFKVREFYVWNLCGGKLMMLGIRGS